MTSSLCITDRIQYRYQQAYNAILTLIKHREAVYQRWFNVKMMLHIYRDCHGEIVMDFENQILE